MKARRSKEEHGLARLGAGLDTKGRTFDELVTLWPMRETFSEIVCCELPFEVVLCGLKRSDRRTHVSFGIYGSATRETHGAALVSRRMFLSFKSCRSGRCWRCFSRESRRSGRRVGERELRSMSAEGSVDLVAMALIDASYVCELQSIWDWTGMCGGAANCPRMWLLVVLCHKAPCMGFEVESGTTFRTGRCQAALAYLMARLGSW